MKEIDKSVNEWFLKEFWPNYPGKYCRGGKGSRAMTLTAMLKVKPDEEERKRILGNLKAQVRAAAQNPDRKWWVIGTTYVNNRMWEDEIESSMEVKERESLKTCQVDQCNNSVVGSSFLVCDRHVPSQHDDKLRAAWKETGLDRNSPTLREDCRAYIISKGWGNLV